MLPSHHGRTSICSDTEYTVYQLVRAIFKLCEAQTSAAGQPLRLLADKTRHHGVMMR